jgi:branched-chain amino acid transport system ATP-binding protein
MLNVTDLRSGYGRIPILAGITLSVSAGEFVGILGHNGMGKSTLLRTLMGYLPMTGGEIIFEGQSLRGLSPTARARRGIGYVPQGREIFPSLSVYENLRMGCVMAKQDESNTIKSILADFPRLERLLDRPGGALSGGEQQLLALARCLCGGPKFILLDEPTEGIQLVEQNLNFITSLSQRVLILQKGMIIREVPPDVAKDRAMMEEYVGMV